jgi:CHAT domain-containing protein
MKFMCGVLLLAVAGGLVSCAPLPLNEARQAPKPEASPVVGADEADRLDNQFMALYQRGEYAEAAKIGERILAIREKSLGPEHPDTAASLNDLADQYVSMGDYARAEPLNQRALAIREKMLGPEHPDTAISLNNLASLHQAKGDYARAEPLYKRALAICEKTLGPEHPNTAIALDNLGGLYQIIGDYARAEPLYKRSLAISEKALGPEHPGTAMSLNNLAELYRLTGDYARAEPIHQRALAVREKVLGPEHPDTAMSLNNLAALYEEKGDYARAEPLNQRALAIREKMLGPEHPDTAISLNNLGGLYRSMGDYARAEPLLKRALAISEKALGPEHPNTASFLTNFASEQGAANKNDEAFDLFQRGLQARNRTIANVFQIATETQKLKFVQQSSGGYEALLSLIHQKFPDDQDKIRAGLDAALSRKAIVFDAQSRQNEAIAASPDPAIKALWNSLATQRSMLAKQLQGGPGRATPEIYRQRVDQLQADIGKLESGLAAKSPLVAADLAQRKVTAERLAALLPSDTVLVEFVKIHDVDWTQGKLSDKQRYLAFVLHPDQRVDLVDLGKAEALEAKGKALLDQLQAQLENMPEDLQRIPPITADRELYDALWKPLVPSVGAATQVVISPDGSLNLVPFAALMAPDGKYLVESLEFSYVTSGRDLARTQPFQPETDLFLAANPDFGVAAKPAEQTPETLPRGKVRSGDFDKESVPFSPLPSTQIEADQVPQLLQDPRKQVMTGAAATETAVLSSRRPKVLHLATHGFFLPDQPEPKPETGPARLDRPPSLPKGYENPLIRSGLAFAGANHAREAQGGADGILTALEVSGMDLHGTALVTLSACQTAVGEVQSGEGVYGLRRAFALSGAEHLMMSLWPVADATTAQQMMKFYQLFGQGTPAPHALRLAQLETIAKLRQDHGQAPPSLWAPFIMQGSPGKL